MCLGIDLQLGTHGDALSRGLTNGTGYPSAYLMCRLRMTCSSSCCIWARLPTEPPASSAGWV